MPRTKTFDRAAILDRAMEVFWKKGYHATSMQDLVDEMGINRSSMYDTYGDKHALFLEALTSYRKRYGISDYYLKFESGQEGINAFVNDYLQTIINDKGQRGCFMLNCSTELTEDKDVHGIVEENQLKLKGLLTELLKKARKQGDLMESKDPGQMADLLVAGLQGVRLMTMIETLDSRRLKKLSENLLDSIF